MKMSPQPTTRTCRPSRWTAVISEAISLRAGIMADRADSLPTAVRWGRIFAATEEARLLANVAAITGARTAGVRLSTGTGSSAPASPGPALVAAANLIRIN
jgi:hypothetical protein